MPISRSVPSGRIALTLGDAAGIGPEVALKAIVAFQKTSRSKVIVLGPEAHYRALARKFRVKPRFDRIEFVFPYPFPDRFRYGRPDRTLATLAVRSIELGARLALEGRLDALVTAPINKASLHRAGFPIPGHTEYLARLSKSKRFEMMLVGGGLRVLPVTRHLALADVPKTLTRKKVEEAVVLAARELEKSFGIRRPRIAVCGLNPHAGENGAFGDEEERLIAPALSAARRRTKARIIGPLAPDALFRDAYRGKYDAEICMYHDQALIPLKTVAQGHGVNVTLGLPYVRTSPDHGSAYDIAGQGIADPASMIEAIRLAGRLVRARR